MTFELKKSADVGKVYINPVKMSTSRGQSKKGDLPFAVYATILLDLEY